MGWPAKVWLYTSGDPRHALRGWVAMDPAHRRHDNMLAWLAQASLTWARDEVLCTQCMTHAPWGSQGDFGVLRDAALELLHNNDWRMDLFQHYYKTISFQLHDGVLTASFGDEDHQAWVWEFVKESWIFQSTGPKSKAGRWYQRFDLSAKALCWWAVFEMTLCYIGIHQGWLTDSEQHMASPLLSTVSALDAAASNSAAASNDTTAGAPQAGATQRLDRSVARSNNRVMDRLFARCENYFHVAFKIFGNTSLRSLWCILRRVTEPQRHPHGRTLVMCDTKRGGVEWGIAMARREYVAELTDIVEAGNDARLLYATGLLSHSERAKDMVHPPQVSQAICEHAFKYIVALVTTELLWLRRYSEEPQRCWTRALAAPRPAS